MIKTHSLPPVNVLFKHTGSEKDKWNTHYTNAWWKNVDINSSKNSYIIRQRGLLSTIRKNINKQRKLADPLYEIGK